MCSDGGLYIGVGETLDAGTFFSGLIDDVRSRRLFVWATKTPRPPRIKPVRPRIAGIELPD